MNKNKTTYVNIMNKNKNPNAKRSRSSWQEFQDKRRIKIEFFDQNRSPTTAKRWICHSATENRKQKKQKNLNDHKLVNISWNF